MTNAFDSVLTTLPGPGRHLQRITRALDEGFSCVWLVPDDLVQRGDADTLLNVLAARSDSIRMAKPEFTGELRVPSPTARPETSVRTSSVPSWDQDRFGLLDLDEPRMALPVPEESRTTVVERLLAALEGEHTGDTVRDLATADSLRNRVIVISGWDEPDVAEAGTFLVQLTAMVKEQGIPPEQRPRLLLAVRERDLTASLLDRIDPVTTQVHWWWGAVGRLDTAVVVAASRAVRDWRVPSSSAERVREYVVNEVLSEVAGPDLTLAASLAAAWDGRISTLRPLLGVLAYDFEHESASGNSARWQKAGSHRPPREMRELWRLGAADLWDGQVRISPALPDAAAGGVDLDALVWRGQNRALMPIIDEQRARLEQIVHARASRTALLQLAAESRAKRRGATGSSRAQDPLELATMHRLDNTGGVTFDRSDRTLLHNARKIRNQLAHLQPLDDDLFEDLLRALPS